ncbi:TPR domain protein [gut metagenome]|uniref:TPR domain protein n=1 Tax=gut metagenome TaxID=749906 RepID=J9GUU0_9ZZZZ
MSNTNETNEAIERARQIIEFTNIHLFLTGKAGTGKTTFLRRLKQENPKNMVVLAPTGIAAINAGGSTIHSFFQLSFAPFMPNDIYRKMNFKLRKEKIKLLRSLDLIIIDEISMVRADLLDQIDAVLRQYRNPYIPFGGCNCS